MKKISALLALPLALLLAFVITSAIPSITHATEATASDSQIVDNQFVDGNWFTIAAANDEAYKEGSPTNEALNAQLKLYQDAVEAGNTAEAEKYAIRSWVKANYAMELGRQALEAKDYAKAKEDLGRALKLAKAAQKPGAGKGEQEDRVCDDKADAWRGCSRIEGERAERRINNLLSKLKNKTGATE